MEDTLAKHPNFGYDSLSSVDGLDRLKFWSSKACASHPNKFDFVITVSALFFIYMLVVLESPHKPNQKLTAFLQYIN